MAKPAKPAAPTKDAAPAEGAAPKSNKLLFIIIGVLVLVIVGGAAWWFLMGSKAGHTEEAPKVEAPKDPKFVPLEAFTVNLQREEADQFLQATMSLKVFDPELEGKIKAMLPEIRSKINLLLSSKKPSEIRSAAGMRKLSADLKDAINNVLGFHAPAHGADPHAAPAAHGATPTEGAAPAALDEHGNPIPAPAAVDENGNPIPVPAALDEHGNPIPAAEGQAAPNAEAAAADVPVHAPPAPAAEGHGAPTSGVEDVLFTSFIIQ
ncbi:MAG: flagellar basal body-associated FliL family protein [Gallionellaceae bacterium]